MDPSKVMAGLTRETQIRRDARGRWFNGEDRIDHPLLVKAFESWIDRADDGRMCLSNDINWAYIEVEGPAYFVRGVEPDDGGIRLRLSGERTERLEPASLRQGPEGGLYCDVREGRVTAQLDRYAATQLMELAGGEDADGPYVELGGRKVRPPVVADPFAASSRSD